MHLISTLIPALAMSGVWIGGSTVTVIVVILIVLLVLRR